MTKNKKGVSTYIWVAFGSAVALSCIITYFIMQFFQKVDVMVAAKTLAPYSGVVTAADFKTIEVSKRDKIYFDGFVTDPKTLEGKMPTTDIIAGQAVKASQFIDPKSAEDAANAVVDKRDRGLYLTLEKENSLHGDVKVGSVVDLYIATTIAKPTLSDPTAKETYVVPFQKSFKVSKGFVNEDKSLSIFLVFPMEESEKYLMLKENIASKKMRLLATLPNMINDKYDGKTLTFTEFNSALLSNGSYFTPISNVMDSRKNSSSTTSNGGTTSVTATTVESESTATTETPKN